METTIHILLRTNYEGAEISTSIVSSHLTLADAQKAMREYGEEILEGQENAEQYASYLRDADTSFEYTYEEGWHGVRLEIHESTISEPRRPQYLAFYKVDNSCGYHRHSFDAMTDAAEILACLHELDDDEWHLYDVTSGSYSNRLPNLDEFVNDYNDEELDGSGWWSIAIY